MRRDPVTPEVYRAVRARDGGCVASCTPLAPGATTPCYGRITLDHVHSKGLQLRGDSTLENLVSLCQHHHRLKTDNARRWRVELDAYLERANARLNG